MNAHIDAKNPSARCLLRWVSEKLNAPKVTEVLKNRVVRIETEGDEEGFSIRFLLKGESAQNVLESQRVSLETILRAGFQEQSGLTLRQVFFTLS